MGCHGNRRDRAGIGKGAGISGMELLGPGARWDWDVCPSLPRGTRPEHRLGARQGQSGPGRGSGMRSRTLPSAPRARLPLQLADRLLPPRLNAPAVTQIASRYLALGLPLLAWRSLLLGLGSSLSHSFSLISEVPHPASPPAASAWGERWAEACMLPTPGPSCPPSTDKE